MHGIADAHADQQGRDKDDEQIQGKAEHLNHAERPDHAQHHHGNGADHAAHALAEPEQQNHLDEQAQPEKGSGFLEGQLVVVVVQDGLAHGVDRKSGILRLRQHPAQRMGHFRARLHAVPGIRPHFKEHPHGLPVRGNEVVPIVLLGQRPPPEFRHGRGVVRFRIDEIRNDDPLGVGFDALGVPKPGHVAQVRDLFTDIGHEIGKQAQRFGREQRVRVKHQIDEIVVPEELVKRVDALQRGIALGKPYLVGIVELQILHLPQEKRRQQHDQDGNRAPSAEDPVGQAAKEKGGHTHLRIVGGASRRIASVERNRGRSADRPRAAEPLPDRPGTVGTA